MSGVKREAITAEKMAEIDKKAVEFGIPRLLLMENAGGAVSRTIMEKFGHELNIIVFAGTGNNGGDGFVAARHLANKGAKVNVFSIGDPKGIRTEEARLNWNVIRRMERSIKVYVVRNPSDLKKAKRYINGADVFLDAMLGTGLRGPLREPFPSIVRLINESGVPVVSVDAPTGLNPSTGEVQEFAVKATYTVTFHKMKKGFSRAKEYTGEVIVADIGIPREIEAAAIYEHEAHGGAPAGKHRRLKLS